MGSATYISLRREGFLGITNGQGRECSQNGTRESDPLRQVKSGRQFFVALSPWRSGVYLPTPCVWAGLKLLSSRKCSKSHAMPMWGPRPKKLSEALGCQVRSLAPPPESPWGHTWREK